MTIREVCDQLRFARSTIYEKIAAGELEAVKIGHATRITAASVEAMLARSARLHPYNTRTAA